MNTGMPRLVTNSKKRCGLIVVGIRPLMAGIDENTSEPVLGDCALELLKMSVAATGQCAGEGDDMTGLRMLNLREVPV